MNFHQVAVTVLSTILCCFSVGCGGGAPEIDPEQAAELESDDYQADMEAGGDGTESP
jgi:hypothetical protein